MSWHFKIAERGAGPYWPLSILRWVMVLIFLAFGIQKFTPQSAHGIVQYISNRPFVWWLFIFGERGEAYLLGIVELSTAVLLAAGPQRAGSVCLNSRLVAAKWISAMVMLQPGLVAAQ